MRNGRGWNPHQLGVYIQDDSLSLCKSLGQGSTLRRRESGKQPATVSAQATVGSFSCISRREQASSASLSSSSWLVAVILPMFANACRQHTVNFKGV